jgi:alkanesulfonate monooxygenase SsuD/methylene tetrahydromethanopterin reductase-like flavin-dependent oxidoreductase (luciferase family)
MEFWYGLYGMQSPRAHPRSWIGMYNDVIEHAVRAEELGFDSFWLTEHHFWYDGYCPSLHPVLAAIAARTSTIGLGTGIFLLGLRDPLRAAEDMATLDALSGGRLIAGVAPGYRPEEFKGLSLAKKTRGKRTYESIELLKKAFTGETFSHVGEHVRSLDRLRLDPRPTQAPHPPLWVGANRSPVQARSVGERGLGYWEGPSMNEETVRENSEVYREAARDAGIPEKDIRVSLFRDVCIAETREEAELIMEEDLRIRASGHLQQSPGPPRAPCVQGDHRQRSHRNARRHHRRDRALSPQLPLRLLHAAHHAHQHEERAPLQADGAVRQ